MMKRVREKSDKTQIVLLIAIIVVLLVLFFLIKNIALTAKVIEKPYTPENCSNETIKKAWESIFKGSSENLTITIPFEAYTILNETDSSGMFKITGCPVYEAYQINGTKVRMLRRAEIFFPGDNELIMASEMELKPEDLENLTSLLKNSSEGVGNYFLFMDEKELLPRNINTSEEAESQFESVFKINSSNWEDSIFFGEEENITINLSENYTPKSYVFMENESMSNITLFGESINPEGNLVKSGFVYANYSLSYFMYLAGYGYGEVRYLSKDFKNWTSIINTSLKNITIEVNNSKLNILDFLLSKLWDFYDDLSGIQKVRILQNNQTIVETEINFTEEFDWTKIILKKQGINSTRGYIIINGLNFTKNITIDRLNNQSKFVCIKDKEINYISEISNSCNSTSEYLLNCTINITLFNNNSGNVSNTSRNFTCKILGDKFIVTGLTHSAVIEILPPPEKPCIQNWTCTGWTDLKKNCGYRTCTDRSNCNNETAMPIEYQQCPVCIPDWNCTTFLPEKCPKSEKRTRTCTDMNSCGTSQGEPDTTQICEKKNNWIWIALGIGIGIIVILLIIIFSLIKRGNIQNFPPSAGHPKPPISRENAYKEHPHYPSRREQGYASNQTGNFKMPITPAKPDKEEYYYPER